jgi:hypothetical protein
MKTQIETRLEQSKGKMLTLVDKLYFELVDVTMLDNVAAYRIKAKKLINNTGRDLRNFTYFKDEYQFDLPFVAASDLKEADESKIKDFCEAVCLGFIHGVDGRDDCFIMPEVVVGARDYIGKERFMEMGKEIESKN